MRRLALAVLLSACAVAPSRGSAPADSTPVSVPAPKLRILGIAQDAGVPQAACESPACEAARADPSRRHRVASVALALPDGEVVLVDATPDLPAQLDEAMAMGRALGATIDPRRPVAGILLTHAHMGHYIGLAHLGFEAAHTRAVPVYATAKMAAFLRANAPWEQLVRLGEIELHEVAPGETIEMGPVKVIPVEVPHRAEYTDTVAYRFEGPHRTVLYVPDTDPWAKHTDPAALFDGVDVALVDGTFFSAGELPGRNVAEIGHPLVRTTIELLRDRVAKGSLRVLLVHLNHSNPLLDPASPAREEARAVGFEIAAEGQEIGL